MCEVGARWVQKEILETRPTADIRVYAIWFDMLAGDARHRWDAEILTDSRVIQMWDSDKLVGQFFADAENFKFGPIAWDVYYLYGPDSQWGSQPSHLVSSGYTIISNRDQLAADVARLTQ